MQCHGFAADNAPATYANVAATLKECANRVPHAVLEQRLSFGFERNDLRGTDYAAATGLTEINSRLSVAFGSEFQTKGRRSDFKNALGFAQLVSRQNIASSLERKTNGSKKVNNSSLLPAIATRPGRSWHSS
jgi:hypothetical protein